MDIAEEIINDVVYNLKRLTNLQSFSRVISFGTNSRSVVRTPKITPPTTRIYYIPSGVRSITKVE